ncbi:MAG: phosphatidate cytidylyltransferase [Candidatus Caenarcaniphilales bacterium]|nr:phosphatidate cytidylyltransferase [Candidatus Caenarcaniphilales bacterium]
MTNFPKITKKDSNHIKRLRGGFLMAFIGFGAMLVGGLPFVILCSILFCVATQELIKLSHFSKLQPPQKPILVLMALFPFFAAFNHNLHDFWLLISVIVTLAYLLFGSVNGTKIQAGLSDMAVSIFILVYVGWFGSHIIMLRFLDEPFGFFSLNFKDLGILYALTVICAVVINDIASYYFGKAFGKTKLAEKISPNKTIKGSICGILFGSLMALFLIHFVGASYFGFKMQWPFSILLALIINSLAQLGDLIESMMKRAAGVKDAGELIEGHGGILDRFDSHILPYVFTLYFFKIYNFYFS